MNINKNGFLFIFQNLVIFDLNENPEFLQNLQKSFPKQNIYYVKMDITKRESIEAAYKQAHEKMGLFDVVVNGSGLMNDRHIDLTIQINLVCRIFLILIRMLRNFCLV